MRLHGTLTRWNDERGFGFITPAKGSSDVFVHISAFPREGGRPRLNELISYELEASPDGKQRAVRVMRPARPAPGRSTATHDRLAHNRRKSGSVLTLLVIAAIGVYGYAQFARRSVSANDARVEAPRELVSPPSHYTCDGRTRCSQMTSCDEARYFLRNCPDTQMDGDDDGEPCESQWCN
jgi:cold shock CspA family protein